MARVLLSTFIVLLCRIGVVLGAVAFILLAPCSVATAGEDRSVIGKWRLTEARDFAEIGSLSDEEAKRLLGRIFIIQKDKVQFGSRICEGAEFEAQRVDIRLFFPREFHVTHENLGLPNPVTAVDLSCTTVFIKNKNQLLIFWRGWFFDAVRVR